MLTISCTTQTLLGCGIWLTYSDCQILLSNYLDFKRYHLSMSALINWPHKVSFSLVRDSSLGVLFGSHLPQTAFVLVKAMLVHVWKCHGSRILTNKSVTWTTGLSKVSKMWLDTVMFLGSSSWRRNTSAWIDIIAIQMYSIQLSLTH